MITGLFESDYHKQPGYDNDSYENLTNEVLSNTLQHQITASRYLFIKYNRFQNFGYVKMTANVLASAQIIRFNHNYKLGYDNRAILINDCVNINYRNPILLVNPTL